MKKKKKLIAIPMSVDLTVSCWPNAFLEPVQLPLLPIQENTKWGQFSYVVTFKKIIESRAEEIIRCEEN